MPTPTKELPIPTTFCTTEQEKRCAQLLAAKLGMSYVKYVHRGLVAFNKANLRAYFHGMSPQEFIDSQNVPVENIEVEAA